MCVERSDEFRVRLKEAIGAPGFEIVQILCDSTINQHFGRKVDFAPIDPGLRPIAHLIRIFRRAVFGQALLG